MLISRQEQVRHIWLVPGKTHVDAIITQQFRDNSDTGPIQAPPVFTLSQWVVECASHTDLLQGRATALSAGSLDLRCMWESVITENIPGIAPEESYALAAQAAHTDRLLEQWKYTARRTSEDTAAGQFGHWRQQLNLELNRRNWFRASDWMRHFAEQIHNKAIPVNIMPESITLSGFVEFTPVETAVLEALRTRGVLIKLIEQPSIKPDTCTKTGYPDLEQEIAAAAQWAKSKFESGCRNIAVVINDLENLSGTVRAIMENTFDPPGVLSHRASEDGAFFMSSGTGLATHMLISDALLLLKLALGGRHQQHEFSDISRLLLSVCWRGGVQERFGRARLEVRIRELGYSKCSLSLLSELAGHMPDPDGVQQLRHCLNAILENQTVSEPVEQLLEWLRLWGWPGTQASTPTSLAAYGNFLQILEQLSRSETSNARFAYRQLLRYCAEARLPGPGGAFSPVQVLSPEQAFGREFDAIRVANLTLENWPPRPVTHAFLPPGAVQQVPRATEQGMLAYTRRLTDWLVSCAPEVRLSWCDRMNDLPLSPSPLIGAFPIRDEEYSGVAGLWGHVCPNAAGIEGFARHPWLRQDQAVAGQPMVITRNAKLSSAVSVLNLQSACPLAAYLVHRLDARMPAVPSPFVDASFRGKLVHAALLELYQPHRGKRSLPGPAQVTAAVQQAMQAQRADRHLLPAIYAAEEQLMEGMLRDWLSHEQHLRVFEIAELEWRAEMTLAGLCVQVQVDRIDRLADGRSVLMDYKTGTSSSSSGWADVRLRDVQLPLYAVLLRRDEKMPPAAVLFANVGLHEAGTEGIGDEPAAADYCVAGYVDKPKALARQLGSWNDTLDAWEQKIDALAQEFIKGDARHQVFDDEALKYAGLDGILRSVESNRWLEERAAHGSD